MKIVLNKNKAFIINQRDEEKEVQKAVISYLPILPFFDLDLIKYLAAELLLETGKIPRRSNKRLEEAIDNLGNACSAFLVSHEDDDSHLDDADYFAMNDEPDFQDKIDLYRNEY